MKFSTRSIRLLPDHSHPLQVMSRCWRGASSARVAVGPIVTADGVPTLTAVE